MLPASTTSLAFVVNEIQQFALQAKGQAQGALSTLQAGNVDSTWVFNLLDRLNAAITVLNSWALVTGLNAYATNEIPNYTGAMTTDISTVTNAAQNCINWVVANFPKDNTNTYILAFSLNADGTRTARQFTSVQTAGLQTALQSFIATIS